MSIIWDSSSWYMEVSWRSSMAYESIIWSHGGFLNWGYRFMENPKTILTWDISQGFLQMGMGQSPRPACRRCSHQNRWDLWMFITKNSWCIVIHWSILGGASVTRHWRGSPPDKSSENLIWSDVPVFTCKPSSDNIGIFPPFSAAGKPIDDYGWPWL